MKIGILTLPFNINYGGILQCYALCTYLKKQGHEPIVLQREAISTVKKWIRMVLCKVGLFKYVDKSYEVGKLIFPFLTEHLNCTQVVNTTQKMQRQCRRCCLDAVLVGSDQVWRREFALKFGFDNFLEFVPSDIPKLSYAASFGLSEWEYTPTETACIKNLLTGFKGISVREEEGVSLCAEHLDIKAQWHVDPTLLLEAKDYEKVASPRLVQEKYVFVYWLGDESVIAPVLKKYEEGGLRVCQISLRSNNYLPSVGDWLSYIKHAEMVVTDSFHGIVFSMIFNRPFHVFCNQAGGFGRVRSLFKALQIEHKINDGDAPLNYMALNERIKTLRAEADGYLREVLI
ncbi:MAG: polysaccharide pyruvyl transferase family protein [Bacteroidaceae bacterium]|nr:polysaccharide pyruvyl transferase family protein [Bacteroidaceae bacterium]